TFLLRQFFLTIPGELEEAARIDGAGRLGILWRIIVPLAQPALATLAIFTFIGFWDDFLWPLITISVDDMRTVQLGLSIFKNEYSIDWPRLMAASTFIQVPVFAVYLAAQRYFVEGVVLSGLKG
ncbi:MAG TPA: carbohydrate ABC transporter permease, partial [Chloroflexota bacterium]|nr:carbohydrate ABC transporter permease [Chloroflexota bacterium]